MELYQKYKQNENLSRYILLFWFYGISDIVGYLIPNPFYKSWRP